MQKNVNIIYATSGGISSFCFLAFLAVLVIPFLPLSLHVLRLIHPLLPVPHHGPVEPPVLLLNHHDAQLVLLVLEHFAVMVVVQLGHCANLDSHAALIFLPFSNVFIILAFFTTFNLLPITLVLFLILFFFLSILFDALFQLLLLRRNIISNPPLGNER